MTEMRPAYAGFAPKTAVPSDAEIDALGREVAFALRQLDVEPGGGFMLFAGHFAVPLPGES